MVIIKALVTCMNDLLSILALQNNTLKQNASVVARVASSANQQEHKNTQRGSGSLHHHLGKNLKSRELLRTQGGTTTWGKKAPLTDMGEITVHVGNTVEKMSTHTFQMRVTASRILNCALCSHGDVSSGRDPTDVLLISSSCSLKSPG